MGIVVLDLVMGLLARAGEAASCHLSNERRKLEPVTVPAPTFRLNRNRSNYLFCRIMLRIEAESEISPVD
ncbi:hypothetical protein F9L69_12775 [Brucella melitensis]|nr:hypothetical protein CK803_16010 [Brucella abortus]OZV60672.1 hypothetical protein BSU07_04655 [Brucella melitensis]ASZ99837.1 hypothetical protein CK806_16595 [Brucella abortus]ATA11203.1 hypothetical protein CK810_13520 [Brucella abortus]ATA14470.1 hypothetical protein CK811_16025 [Brucella abortus]